MHHGVDGRQGLVADFSHEINEEVLLMASELRLSQTQYKRKGSLSYFKVAVEKGEEGLVRPQPMPTTTLMSSTISEHMG